MAQAINCDLCNGEGAILMQTNLDTGAVMAVGAACLVTFMMAGTAELIQGMPPEVASEYGALFDKIAAADARPDRPANVTRRSRGKSKAGMVPPDVDEPTGESSSADGSSAAPEGKQPCPACGSSETGALDGSSKVCGACGNTWVA